MNVEKYFYYTQKKKSKKTLPSLKVGSESPCQLIMQNAEGFRFWVNTALDSLTGISIGDDINDILLFI